MSLMDKLAIQKFKFYLMEQLVNQHNVSELEAQRIIAKSAINKMLKISPEFVMHYSVEDNAEDIWNEYMGITIEM